MHPVPTKLLTHIGDIVVYYSLLESSFHRLSWALVYDTAEVRKAITAELPFRGVRGLAVNLYRARHGEDDDYTALRELSKRAAELEDIRNQIMHSRWGSQGDPTYILRVKVTAKEKRGVHHELEKMDEESLHDIADRMRRLGDEVSSFQKRLAETGKVQEDWM